MARSLMDVIADCHRACATCSGGTNSKNGRLACNLRDDSGKLAPIDCVIPRIAAAVELTKDPGPLMEEASTEYIQTHIRSTDPFPPAGASQEAKTQAAKAAPLVAVVAAQSSGQPEVAKKVIVRSKTALASDNKSKG